MHLGTWSWLHIADTDDHFIHEGLLNSAKGWEVGIPLLMQVGQLFYRGIIFLRGGGNLTLSDFDHSHLFQS